MKARNLATGCGLVALLVASTAIAQEPSAQQPQMFGHILDALTRAIRDRSVIQTAATGLLFALLTLEMAQWGLSRVMGSADELQGTVMGLLRPLIIGLLFLAFVVRGPEFLSGILAGFRYVALTLTGISSFDAGSLMSRGIELATRTIGSIGVLDALSSPIVSLAIAVASLCLLIAFVVASIQLLLAQIEAVVVISLAPLVFAFGALRQTRDVGTKPFQHAISTGFKLVVIALLASVMTEFAQYASSFLATARGIEDNWGLIFELIAAGVFLIILAFFMPTIASSILSGAASMTAGHAITSGAGMAAGAAALTAGAAAAAGGAANGLTTLKELAASGNRGVGDAISASVGEGGGRFPGGMGDMRHAGAESISGGATLLRGTARDMALSRRGSSRGGDMSGSAPVGGLGADAAPNVGTAPPTTPTKGPGAAPSSTAPAAPRGDASGASPEPNATSSSTSSADGQPGGRADGAFYRRLKDLEGYIPQGMSHAPGAEASIGGQERPRNVVATTFKAVGDAAGKAGEFVGGIRDAAQTMDDRTAVHAPIEHRGGHHD